MLSRLYISNYAIIDELEITFGPGLTIITGETGAGKSIIMGALSLILGQRADARALHDTARKMVVEATVDISDHDLKDLLAGADIDQDDRECVLRREVTPAGRSRAFVNDTPVPLAFLRETATRLIDLHSQHSNMLLSDSAFQLSIIDSLAGNERTRQEYAELFRQYRETERQLSRLADSCERARSEEDYMRFQLDQLASLNLQPGEDRALESRQATLSNVTEIKQTLWEVDNLLNNENSSVIDSLRVIGSRLGAIEPLMPELQGLPDRVEAALIDLRDMARTLATAQEGLQLDPAELEQIESRLNDIFALERKHRVDTCDQLLDIQHALEKKLDALNRSDEQLLALREQSQQLEVRATQVAQALSQSRRQSAKDFATHLALRAKDLGLNNLRFDIRFDRTALSPSGIDDAEFLIAFNKNQPLMPVKETASGGEISRVMLCVKAICAQRVSLPTIILDEVDTGVSGDTASMMGDMMGDIARNTQVIAITHLPQVAAHGDHHLKVYKTDREDRTTTRVATLDHEQHINEIARMLSGKDINRAAVDNARALVGQNKKA